MDLVKIDNFEFIEKENDYYISGVEICRKLGYVKPNDQAYKIWKKYSNNLDKNSVVAKLETTDGKQYDTRCYNEAGALFFITKCNIQSANEITEAMINAFLKIREAIKNQSNKTWFDARFDNKLTRKTLMDVIASFVELAKDQGSTNAKMYYMNFTKLVQKNLFYITSLKKINKNLRDCLDSDQLAKLTAVEVVLKEELSSLIAEGEFYKTSYVILKNKIERLIELLGQSPPALLDQEEQRLIMDKSIKKSKECCKNIV